jgi:hypothetical protein
MAIGVSSLCSRYIGGPDAGNLAGEVILLCSECQSLVKGLQNGPLATMDPVVGRVWWHLISLVRSIRVRALVVQWVPGHVGLHRMMEIDAFAKAQQTAADIRSWQDGVPAPLEGAKAAIRKALKERWRGENVVSGFLTRADEALLV